MRSCKPLLLTALIFALTASAAAAAKVDVCHVTGSGSILTLNVNANALPAHLGHGDFLPPTFYADADGDGFGDAATAAESCEAPAGFVADGSDCDDADAAVNPDADEVEGDGVDNDCNPDTPDVPAVSCVCNSDPEFAAIASGADPIVSCHLSPAIPGVFSRYYDSASGSQAVFHHDSFLGNSFFCYTSPWIFVTQEQLLDCFTVFDQAAADAGVACPW